MRIHKIIAVSSMILLASATTIGTANSQQVVQVTTTPTQVIKPSSILTPGDNVVLLTTTQSAVIPGTNITADIHTPSLLPPGTQMVRGFSGCDTAIILPGMADMPSAEVLTIRTQAAVAPAAVEQVEVIQPAVQTTPRTTTVQKVYRQVKAKKVFRKAPAKRIRHAEPEILK
jgi:hypothetical protein